MHTIVSIEQRNAYLYSSSASGTISQQSHYGLANVIVNANHAVGVAVETTKSQALERPDGEV
jgi:hypothetical protein